MNTPSLRERKAANTRVGLLEALLSRLDDRPLADIAVKELCSEVGISQATFFNYFPDKTGLLVFFLGLWSVEMAGLIVAHDRDDPLGAIQAVFLETARQSDAHPGAQAEIVAFQARYVADTPPTITDADLLRAYPDRPELLDVPRDAGLERLLAPLLQRAIELGHLPAHTDPMTAMMGIATVFFGVAVLRRQVPGLPAEVAYGTQLQWIWQGLRALPPT